MVEKEGIREMNKYTLGTIIGTALLGLAKAKKGGRNSYKPRKIESIYKLPKSKKAQITELDLSRMGLTQIPDDIFDGFTNLEKLNLGYNQLIELPESIGNLTNLEELGLDKNQLTELPESIGNLTNLKWLWLPENQLTELPQSIGNLTNLTQLVVSFNELTELPEAIGNLTNLEILWLDNNPWKKPVPKETILKMIRNRVHKDVINSIIDMNNSIPTKSKSNLRLR